MRPWRKVYATIIDSDRLATVGDAAHCLYTLLLVAQDDNGCYPWTPAKMRALCVGRDWSGSKLAATVKELIDAGLIESQGDLLHIVGGESLNGKPHNARETFLYPTQRQIGDNTVAAPAARQRQHSDNTATTKVPLQPRARGEQNREEQNREEQTSRVRAREADDLKAEKKRSEDDFQEAAVQEAMRSLTEMTDDPEAKAERSRASEVFDRLYWELYPTYSDGRRCGQTQAWQAFVAHVNPDEYDLVLERAKDYGESERVKRGKVMALSTWLDSGWKTTPKPPVFGERDSGGQYRLTAQEEADLRAMEGAA